MYFSRNARKSRNVFLTESTETTEGGSHGKHGKHGNHGRWFSRKTRKTQNVIFRAFRVFREKTLSFKLLKPCVFIAGLLLKLDHLIDTYFVRFILR